MTMTLKRALLVAGISAHSASCYTREEDFVQSLQNWSKLHPELAKLKANDTDVDRCRAYLVLELTRPEDKGGPRAFYVDRLYKRMSNLRREMEREVLAVYLETPMAEAA